MLLDTRQLSDQLQCADANLCAAGVMFHDTLENDDMISGVIFQAMSRVFLVKLLQRYGQRLGESLALSARFTPNTTNVRLGLLVSTLALWTCIQGAVGEKPMQYVLAYCVEQAVEMIKDARDPWDELQLIAGLQIRRTFSRSFKQIMGQTPRQFRATQSKPKQEFAKRGAPVQFIRCAPPYLLCQRARCHPTDTRENR